MKDETLIEMVKVRCMPGTRAKVKKLLKAFPQRFENESHFYRAAIFRFCNEIEAEKFERDLQRAHEKRLKVQR